MKDIKPSLSDKEKSELQNALNVIRSGGIILYPTDTVWGIGCDATNDAAIEKIFALKKRNEEKSMIALLDTENKLQRYVKDVPDIAWQLIEFADKPLTIIYDNGLNVSKHLIASDQSLAIRITKDPFCRQLIYNLGKPLVSTSANISGSPTPGSFNEITSEVLTGVDYVVNLRQNQKNVLPSSIIKLNNKGHIQIIRK